MEQITRRDGVVYYGEKRCSTVEEAYVRFRNDYHESLGRVAYRRLNRLGSRKERIHGYGFVFRDDKDFSNIRPVKVPVYLLGIISGSYCRFLSGRYIPEVTEEEVERWIDWVFRKESKALRLIGTKYKMGRTSKRLNTRYR